jgi:dTDP-4-dehydrorhamnose reductase
VSIAVIGAGGQLGQALCELIDASTVAPLTHQDVELTDRASLERALRPLAPTVVINTAAFNLVDDAESRPADAFATNAFGVRELAGVCRDLGCTLVHFSTDYVFGIDRSRDRPYEESEVPGPLSVYGLSKLAGEYFVRSICPRHFVIRTCGLYGLRGSGGKGRNFVQTMLRLGRERGQVRVVNDQTCTPTSAADLAAATLQLLATDAFGLYHWTNSGSCTWHEFACEIFRVSQMAVQCEAITSVEFGARAARPAYSVLSTAKIEKLGMKRPRPWQEALSDYLKMIRSVSNT